MNDEVKVITVQFFKLIAEDTIVKKFCGSFKSLVKLSNGADVVSNAQGRYIINCINSKDKSITGCEMLFWATIKERNTWQVRSKQDGNISGLETANSIVGDISYFKLNPKQKIIVAFTAYSLTGYLKAMCNLVFRRLTTPTTKFTIDYLSDDMGISQIKKWDYFSKMSIKLDTQGMIQRDEQPQLINALLDITDNFGGKEISIILQSGKDKLTHQNVSDTLNYLSDNDNCRSLSLSEGLFEEDEKFLPINLKRAFVKYRTFVKLKRNQKYIDVEQGDYVLTDALLNTKF